MRDAMRSCYESFLLDLILIWPIFSQAVELSFVQFHCLFICTGPSQDFSHWHDPSEKESVGFYGGVICCCLFVVTHDSSAARKKDCKSIIFGGCIIPHMHKDTTGFTHTPKDQDRNLVLHSAWSLKESIFFRSYVHCEFHGPRQNFIRLLAP